MRTPKFRAPISRDGAKCYKYSKDYSSLGAFFDAVVRDEGWMGYYEQFTELIDKHEKEIYEGDVVNVCQINCKGTIVFGMHAIGTDDYGVEHKTPGFSIAWPGSDDAGHTGMDTEMEILGNIYENPGLVNEQSSRV